MPNVNVSIEKSLQNALREKSASESTRRNYRVTMSGLVIEAIEAYLGGNGKVAEDAPKGPTDEEKREAEQADDDRRVVMEGTPEHLKGTTKGASFE